MLLAEPHHIIAIGASAGGLEEINSFFDHTPLDGVSYVIVQHLSADFKSRMLELLSRHSKLIVKEAEDGMVVECNQVYLIPNDKFMTIRDGRLCLTNKENVKGPHLTINIFLNSLALNSDKKAIGIILSGLGSDGTEGIMAIKEAGGMVIARNPETTQFSSMPASAIATGLVDFILEPELMPGIIEDYVKKNEGGARDHEDDARNVITIVNLIKEQSPLDFSEYKSSTILRRIKRRATYNNISGLAKYIEFLKATPEEIGILAKDFLISVTAFFRDKEAFDFIQSDIIPGMLETLEPGEELKLWVAGCATGEEAYSLAILIHENLGEKFKDTVVKIFATDIDSDALAFAGRGIYNAGIVKQLSSERLQRCFLKEGKNYKINPAIRKMVIFAQHDLVKNPPYCNMHLISCRNLLIYMTPALQKKIYLMLLFGLKMDGVLFLGSSENPLPIIEKLKVVSKKHKIYKNLESRQFVRFDAFSLPVTLDKKQAGYKLLREETSQTTSNLLAEGVYESLVKELDCLVICLDENNQVIKSFGDTSKYILQKNFTSNLAELLPRPLAIAFNTLRRSSLKSNEKATASGIKIRHGESIVKVNLSVSPLEIRKGVSGSLMVTFSEDRSPALMRVDEFDENKYLDQYSMNLEEELKELKEKLYATYQQLDASNDNMQSFNEELLSANEEMQSTNEEMQSVNEELHTINSDYQLKNRELLELNDDLNNYFRSNINGQLFVNNDLRLMKFSPSTVKQINLLPSDIGRPLSNISTNIKFETILDDIRHVLTEGAIITKEIESNDGKWYQIWTMPYIQQADNISGAIITFNDITELKKTQQELDQKNASLLRINADLDNFVHTASHDLLAPLANIEISIGLINRMKIIEPEVVRFLNIIDSSVKKFRSLVHDISIVASLQNDITPPDMVNLEETINNIEWSLDDKIKTSGATLIRNLQVKDISFSRKNLRSIVYNLISNSIKFKGASSPVINIESKKEGNYVVLSVRDNGKGIKGDHFDTIFERYARLDQDVEGQGVGLYLMKKIVYAAGGNITIESEPGKGSKFSIYLKDAPEYAADPSIIESPVIN